MCLCVSTNWTQAKVGLQLVTYPVGKKVNLMKKKIGLATMKAKAAEDENSATNTNSHEKEMEAFYAHQVTTGSFSCAYVVRCISTYCTIYTHAHTYEQR